VISVSGKSAPINLMALSRRRESRHLPLVWISSTLHPRTHHQVEVQTGRQRLPQPEAFVLEPNPRLEGIVRADHRGVAAGVAPANPGALDHGDLLSMITGEALGAGAAVPAVADQHGIAAVLRLGAPPGPRPALMAVQCRPDDAENRMPRARYPGGALVLMVQLIRTKRGTSKQG